MTATTQRLKPAPTSSILSSSDNRPTVVLCSGKDNFLLSQDICTLCGSIGKEDEGNLISCSQCGQCYHPYCVTVKGLKVAVSKGWRCLECTVCETCGQPGDEAKLLLCDECELSCHTYCLDPPLENVPQGAWKCHWCVVCQQCGNHSPGVNSDWQKNYTECGPCSSRSTCPKCRIDYKERDLVIQCLNCSRWLHAICDSIKTEDDCELAMSLGYTCLLCRPKNEVRLNLSQRKSTDSTNRMSNSNSPIENTDQQYEHQDSKQHDTNVNSPPSLITFSSNNNIVPGSIELDNHQTKHTAPDSSRPQSAPLSWSKDAPITEIKRPSSSLYFTQIGSKTPTTDTAIKSEAIISDELEESNIDQNSLSKADGNDDDFFQGLHMVDGVYLSDAGLNFMKSHRLEPAKRQRAKKIAKLLKPEEKDKEKEREKERERDREKEKEREKDKEYATLAQGKKGGNQNWESDEALGNKATKSAVLYANIEHPNLKQDYRSLEERMKQIQKLWRQLPSEKRKSYVEKARENRSSSKSSNKPAYDPMAAGKSGIKKGGPPSIQSQTINIQQQSVSDVKPKLRQSQSFEDKDTSSDFNILDYADPEQDKGPSAGLGEKNIELDADLEEYLDDDKRIHEPMMFASNQQTMPQVQQPQPQMTQMQQQPQSSMMYQPAQPIAIQQPIHMNQPMQSPQIQSQSPSLVQPQQQHQPMGGVMQHHHVRPQVQHQQQQQFVHVPQQSDGYGETQGSRPQVVHNRIISPQQQQFVHVSQQSDSYGETQGSRQQVVHNRIISPQQPQQQTYVNQQMQPQTQQQHMMYGQQQQVNIRRQFQPQAQVQHQHQAPHHHHRSPTIQQQRPMQQQQQMQQPMQQQPVHQPMQQSISQQQHPPQQAQQFQMQSQHQQIPQHQGQMGYQQMGVSPQHHQHQTKSMNDIISNDKSTPIMNAMPPTPRVDHLDEVFPLPDLPIVEDEDDLKDLGADFNILEYADPEPDKGASASAGEKNIELDADLEEYLDDDKRIHEPMMFASNQQTMPQVQQPQPQMTQMQQQPQSSMMYQPAQPIAIQQPIHMNQPMQSPQIQSQSPSLVQPQQQHQPIGAGMQHHHVRPQVHHQQQQQFVHVSQPTGGYGEAQGPRSQIVHNRIISPQQPQQQTYVNQQMQPQTQQQHMMYGQQQQVNIRRQFQPQAQVQHQHQAPHHHHRSPTIQQQRPMQQQQQMQQPMQQPLTQPMQPIQSPQIQSQSPSLVQPQQQHQPMGGVMQHHHVRPQVHHQQQQQFVHVPQQSDGYGETQGSRPQVVHNRIISPQQQQFVHVSQQSDSYGETQGSRQQVVHNRIISPQQPQQQTYVNQQMQPQTQQQHMMYGQQQQVNIRRQFQPQAQVQHQHQAPHHHHRSPTIQQQRPMQQQQQMQQPMQQQPMLQPVQQPMGQQQQQHYSYPQQPQHPSHMGYQQMGLNSQHQQQPLTDKNPIVGYTMTTMEFNMYEQGSGSANEAVNEAPRPTSGPPEQSTGGGGQPQNQLLKQLLGNCSSADNPPPNHEQLSSPLVARPPAVKTATAKQRKNDYIAERRAALEKEKTPPPREVKPKKRIRGPNKRPKGQFDGDDQSAKTLPDGQVGPPPRKRVRKSKSKTKLEDGTLDTLYSSLATKIKNELPVIYVKEPESRSNINIGSIFACGDLSSRCSKLRGTFGRAVPTTNANLTSKDKQKRRSVGYYHEEFPTNNKDTSAEIYNRRYSIIDDLDRDCDSPGSIISGSASESEDIDKAQRSDRRMFSSRLADRLESAKPFTPDLDRLLARTCRSVKDASQNQEADLNNNARPPSPSIPIRIKLPVRAMSVDDLDKLSQSDDKDETNKENFNEEPSLTSLGQNQEMEVDSEQATDLNSTSLNMRLRDHGNVSVTLTLNNKEADGVKRVLNSLSQLIDFPIASSCLLNSPESDTSNQEDAPKQLGNSFRLLTGGSRTKLPALRAQTDQNDLKFNEHNYIPSQTDENNKLCSLLSSKTSAKSTDSTAENVDVKPDICYSCKTIVVDKGIRKSSAELAKPNTETLQQSSLIESEPSRMLVFCSIQCYTSCIMAGKPPGQLESDNDSYSIKAPPGLPPMSPMMEDDEDEVAGNSKDKAQDMDKLKVGISTGNAAEGSKLRAEVRYTRWSSAQFKSTVTSVSQPSVEVVLPKTESRDLIQNMDTNTQSSSINLAESSSVDSNESDNSTGYGQLAACGKPANCLDDLATSNLIGGQNDVPTSQQFDRAADESLPIALANRDISVATKKDLMTPWPEGMNLIQVRPIKSFTKVQGDESAESVELYQDTRKCVLCHQLGDGESDGPARLLNLFIDGWVHLNCALWSLDVYELANGALMNVELACRKAMSCSLCHKPGATLKCFKPRCPNYYHFLCALKEKCSFYEDKSVQCRQHSKSAIVKELTSFVVKRKVYVNRDEQKQVAEMIQGEQQSVMRIGSLVFLNIGQLLPHQLAAFHDHNNIFPVGYKVIRYYWSHRQFNKRCKYLCTIEDNDGRPQFRVIVQELGYADECFLGETPHAAWRTIINSMIELRSNKPDIITTFPAYIRGEDLFGLNEPSIVRILESLPGVETLTDYEFKFGRSPLLELPLAINPTGCARTEPKLRTHFKRPYTIHTASSVPKSRLQSLSSGDSSSSPYIKQFVHSKSSQYRKMKSEWRNNVVLARSRVQGLGLYAARDIEKHTMVIEYIGMLIRNEIAERYERIHEAHNRGIYMFRLDEDRVIDATLAGGLARYINHSCNPNCVAEAVEIDRERKILIIANRKILKGEELGYDYKLAIEDDQHKISCLCGAPSCKKWMN